MDEHKWRQGWRSGLCSVGLEICAYVEWHVQYVKCIDSHFHNKNVDVRLLLSFHTRADQDHPLLLSERLLYALQLGQIFCRLNQLLDLANVTCNHEMLLLGVSKHSVQASLYVDRSLVNSVTFLPYHQLLHCFQVKASLLHKKGFDDTSILLPVFTDHAPQQPKIQLYKLTIHKQLVPEGRHSNSPEP